MALQILNPRLNKLELGYTTVDSLPTENINPRAIYRIIDKDNGKEYFWRWNDEKWDDMSAKELGEFLITQAGTYRAGGSLTGLENIEAGQSYILKKELPKDALAQLYEMAGEDGVLLKLMDMEGFGPFKVQANVMLTLSDWELVIKKIGEEYLLMSRINETIESTLPSEQLPENYAPVHNMTGDYYATEALELDGRAYPKGWSITASLMLVVMMNANESMMQQLLTPAHYPNLPIRIHVPTTEQWVSPECEELFKSCIYGFWNISEDFYNLVGKMQQLPLSTNDSDQKKYAEEKITKNEGFVVNEDSDPLIYVQEDFLWDPQTEGTEYMFYSLMGLMLLSNSNNTVPHPFIITMGQNFIQGMGAILNDPFKIIYRESLGAYCFEASTMSLQLDGPTSGGSTVVGYWVVDKEKFLSQIQMDEGMVAENKWYVDYRILNPRVAIMLCPARVIPYQPYEAPKDGFNKVDVDIKQTKLYASKNGFYSPKATPVVIGQMNHLKEIYTLEDIQAYTSKATGKSGTSDGYSCMSYIVYGSDSASDILSAMMSSQITISSYPSINFHQIVLIDAPSQMNEHLTDGWIYLFNAKTGFEAGLCGVDEDGWYKVNPFELLTTPNFTKVEHAPDFFVQKDSFNAAPIEVARVLFAETSSWDSFDSVIVNVPEPRLQEKSLYLQESPTTVKADEGYDGLQSVTVRLGNTYTNQISDLEQQIAALNIKLDFIFNGNEEDKNFAKLVNITQENDEYAVSGVVSKDLTEIIIPASITKIGSKAFQECENLTSVTTHNDITSIGERAFYKCSNLENFIIPNKVERLEKYVFYGCKKLSTITIPESVKTIDDSVFGGCDEMTEIIIPDTVTNLESECLGGCKTLTRLTIPFTGRTINSGSTSDGVFAHLFDAYNAGEDYEYKSRYYKTGGRSMYRSIPLALTEVTVTKKVSSYGFCGCGKIEKIILAEGITSIPDHAFYQCSGLKEVVFPSTLTTIGSSAFHSCTSITSINIPNTITSIESSAFSSCDNLEEVTIPDSITSISQQTFWSCGALHTVNLPATVTYLASDIFGYCSNLTSINFAGTMAQWSAISKINWKRNNSTITQVVCSDGAVAV